MAFVAAMKKYCIARINATIRRQRNTRHEVERDSVFRDFYLAFKEQVFSLYIPTQYRVVHLNGEYTAVSENKKKNVTRSIFDFSHFTNWENARHDTRQWQNFIYGYTG